MTYASSPPPPYSPPSPPPPYSNRMDRREAAPPYPVASGSGHPALGSDPNPSFAIARGVAAPPSSVEVPQAENLDNAPIPASSSFLKGVKGRLICKVSSCWEDPFPPGSNPKFMNTPPAFDLLKGGVPKQTMSTWIPAWASLVSKDTATVDLEELNVQSVSHHKMLVQEYQLDFAVVEVSTRGYVFMSPPLHYLMLYGGGTLHLALERGLIISEQTFINPYSNKPEGRADDRLSILSEPDVKDYHLKAPLIRTLRWDTCKGPPLLEVMQLLCLVSTDFPFYFPKTINCYHFVAVSCLAMQVYRGIHRSPSIKSGAAASKFLHFAGMGVMSADGTALAFFRGWRYISTEI